MAQMKEQSKTPEKELRNKVTAVLPDAEFKTLVIGILTELTDYSCKIKEKVRAIQSEIHKEATVKGRKLGLNQ